MKRYIIDAQTLRQPSFEADIEVGHELLEAMDVADISLLKVELQIAGQSVQSNKIEIHIKGNATVTLPCDRCLDDLTLNYPVEESMTVFIGSEAVPFDGYEQTVQTGDCVNLAQFIYDSIMVQMPIIKTHPIEECNQEMVARISGFTE